MSEKYRAAWEALDEAKKKALAEAAEQKRRADCYDQLVERVKELEEALSGVVERFGPTADELIFSKRMAINKARAALSKSLPNTVAEAGK